MLVRGIQIKQNNTAAIDEDGRWDDEILGRWDRDNCETGSHAQLSALLYVSVMADSESVP